MRRVAGETQGLETTFLDLENVGDEEVLAAIRDNTKVRFFWWNDERLINVICIYSLSG